MVLIVALWICLCAYVNCVGWLLSAISQLNAEGYLFAGFLGGLGGWFWLKKAAVFPRRQFSLAKTRRRFRRPFPCLFLILAGLVFIGGAIYPPNNFDHLTYRFPRMLHWLADGGWHWIHVQDQRLNTRACGFEWLSLPLFCWFKTDRLFFLPNIISFLLLPGLIFSVLVRSGVRRRVAWHWMWVLPSGYTFVLQAGGAANDLFSVVFVLAAVDFALRSRETGKISFAWLSILAAALFTGAKASNLPLLLPWAFALMLSWRQWLARPMQLAAIFLIAIFCSFLPNAVFNLKYCGDWSGAKIENQSLKINNPFDGISGNVITLASQTLAPPFPLIPAAKWSKLRNVFPPSFVAAHDREFEVHMFNGDFGGIMTEDGAGLGLGVGMLLIVSVGWSWIKAKARPSFSRLSKEQIILIGLPWISALVFMANIGAGQLSRLMSPYFPLLLPLLLLGLGHEQLVRQKWWRWSAALVLGVAMGVVIITPARPLFPAQTLLGHVGQHSAFLAHAEVSYRENRLRPDGLSALRDRLSPQTHVVGLASDGNDLEPSLWRPFGQRRVEYVLSGDTADDLRRRHIEYVMIAGDTLGWRKQNIDEWLEKYRAEKVDVLTIVHSYPPYVPSTWYIARLKP